MNVHPNFADWYRPVALTPPDGLLSKRWAGVEDAVGQLTPSLLVSLAELFTLPHRTESTVPKQFRECFRAHDDGFPSRDNLQELRVLAGAVLRLVIEQRSDLSPLAALAVVCGGFGPREALLPEREHLEIAQQFLMEYSRTTRECVAPKGIDVTSFTNTQFRQLLPQNLFAPNMIPNLSEPLISTLTEIGSALSFTQEQTNRVIEQLCYTLRVREEEVRALWWLQTQFSRDLQKSFSEIGYEAGTLIFPMELADLTIFVPGPETEMAILIHALYLAGLPSSSDTVTIASATNAVPRDWREQVCSRHTIQASPLMSPILLAIHKSIETDGRDEWLPVYRKACDIPPDKAFPLIQISHQLFRERMLLRAAGEMRL